MDKIDKQQIELINSGLDKTIKELKRKISKLKKPYTIDDLINHLKGKQHG